jgi:GAF domain-containing protein
MSTLSPDAAALDTLAGHAVADDAAILDPGAARAATSPSDGRTRFAFLAETSRCLADSLDFETTLETGAGLALPHFGTWCMVDIVEADDTIRRVSVIHPDPEKQRLARAFYRAHPPGRDDSLGAPRVIRTRESEFVVAYDEVLEGITEEEHRALLHDLGARSFLMVPMSARGKTLGAITFVSDDRR